MLQYKSTSQVFHQKLCGRRSQLFEEDEDLWGFLPEQRLPVVLTSFVIFTLLSFEDPLLACWASDEVGCTKITSAEDFLTGVFPKLGFFLLYLDVVAIAERLRGVAASRSTACFFSGFERLFDLQLVSKGKLEFCTHLIQLAVLHFI